MSYDMDKLEKQLQEITLKLIHLSNLNDVDDGDKQARAAMKAYNTAADLIIRLQLDIVRSER